MIRAYAATTVRLTERTKRSIHMRAVAFVAERYGLEPRAMVALECVPIRWRRGSGASAFYPRPAHGFTGPHILLRVPSGDIARWHTYRRARARFSTPPGGIPLDVRILASAVLVHELTHALQHGISGAPRRRYSEVETTGNEIEFVRRAAPEAFAQLVPVVRAAPRGRARAVIGHAVPPRAPVHGIVALRAAVIRLAGRLGAVIAPPRVPRGTRSPTPTGS